LTLFDPGTVSVDASSGPGDAKLSGVGSPPEPATAGVPASPSRPADPAAVESSDGAPPALRLRLQVAYDGGGFHGFAAQEGQRTVAGVLAEALQTVVRHPVRLVCAGRTDRGVHAQSQVVHVDVRPGIELDRLVRSVNALVGPDVVVVDAAEVDGTFDARHSARRRSYRYLVHEATAPDPWWRGRVWTVPGPLDLRAMQAGADALLGEHDFRSFCRRPPGHDAETPVVRRVLDARWSVVPAPAALVTWGQLLRFDVTAVAFCHQMVRSVVGLLVAVGQGRQRPADVHWALQRGDRTGMPDPAPPGGLSLVGVDY